MQRVDSVRNDTVTMLQREEIMMCSEGTVSLYLLTYHSSIFGPLLPTLKRSDSLGD